MNARLDWEELVRIEGRRQLYRMLSYIVGEELDRAVLRVVEERCERCRVPGYCHACSFEDDEDDVYDEALRDLDVEYVRQLFLETARIRLLDPKLVDFDEILVKIREKWVERQFREEDGPSFMRSMNAGLYSDEFYSEAEAVFLARERVDRRLEE